MRKAQLAVFAFMMSACSASPPASEKPQPPTFKGSETTGEKIATIHVYCSNLAAYQCPGATIRCDAYRSAFIKGCLVKTGVPPDYIAVLTTPY